MLATFSLARSRAYSLANKHIMYAMLCLAQVLFDCTFTQLAVSNKAVMFLKN